MALAVLALTAHLAAAAPAAPAAPDIDTAPDEVDGAYDDGTYDDSDLNDDLNDDLDSDLNDDLDSDLNDDLDSDLDDDLDADEREIFALTRRAGDAIALADDDAPIEAGLHDEEPTDVRYREALRRRRRARLGIEVTLGWRRRTTARDVVDGAARNELWLTATWRL